MKIFMKRYLAAACVLLASKQALASPLLLLMALSSAGSAASFVSEYGKMESERANASPKLSKGSQGLVTEMKDFNFKRMDELLFGLFPEMTPETHSLTLEEITQFISAFKTEEEKSNAHAEVRAHFESLLVQKKKMKSMGVVALSLLADEMGRSCSNLPSDYLRSFPELLKSKRISWPDRFTKDWMASCIPGLPDGEAKKELTTAFHEAWGEPSARGR